MSELIATLRCKLAHAHMPLLRCKAGEVFMECPFCMWRSPGVRPRPSTLQRVPTFVEGADPSAVH